MGSLRLRRARRDFAALLVDGGGLLIALVARMKTNACTILVAVASLTLIGCAASTDAPGGSRARSSTGDELPPGLPSSFGAFKFMSCISKLDGGPDLTELHVGNGRYLVCTSRNVNSGQETQEDMDDDGKIWDVTWAIDHANADGTKDAVLTLTTNEVGKPWVVTATRDGDEIVIPIPSFGGVDASPIFVDISGHAVSWSPAATQ
jgi:hypothetical protein